MMILYFCPQLWQSIAMYSVIIGTVTCIIIPVAMLAQVHFVLEGRPHVPGQGHMHKAKQP